MGDRLDALTAHRWPERVALLFALGTGVIAIVLALGRMQAAPELDYHAYYYAGQAVLDGEPFVGTAIHEGTFLTEKEYVYLPITAPIFSIYALLPSRAIGYVLNAGLLVVVLALLARLTIDVVETYGGTLYRIDRYLIVGVYLLSGHSILALHRGNIDPIVLLGLAVGLLAIERGSEVRGGVLWAIAATFKLFPAFLGIWLLYRRKGRAIGAAVLTGVGAIVLSVLAFGPDAHVRWVEFLVTERSRQDAFAGGLDPTFLTISLRRPLSQVLPLSGTQLMVLSALIMAPVLYLVYREAETDLDHLVTYFATMLVLLITVVPTTMNYVIYLYFPLVPLLYLTEDRRTRRWFAAGLVLVSVPLFPQHVEMLVDASPHVIGLGDEIVAVTRFGFSYASFPLIGVLALLAGCHRFVDRS